MLHAPTRSVCRDMNSSEESTPPNNFSWVVPRQIAGMAAPRLRRNVQFIVDVGIEHLITLSNEMRPYNDVKDFPQLKWSLIKVEEFEAPSLNNIKKFIKICKKCKDEGQTVGVHCRQGLGRTGVMLACYLIHFQGVTPERALTTIRQMRPWSVETYEQERVLFQYHDYLRSCHE